MYIVCMYIVHSTFLFFYISIRVRKNIWNSIRKLMRTRAYMGNATLHRIVIYIISSSQRTFWNTRSKNEFCTKTLSLSSVFQTFAKLLRPKVFSTFTTVSSPSFSAAPRSAIFIVKLEKTWSSISSSCIQRIHANIFSVMIVLIK